ncbi:leucine--tRNA ligase [Ichthyobacterium seriolicida]|uniref:Leucine--tRNA ligase n=1 Tax=Ichthyobacterium seriolicida TaxID=242600 RepID=A0A1J1DZ03_9FLAO|nr:leucine--tRNA ligase [Ichthyobacterium seriolicida]BAV95154.1 leucyl-tRNA synthetase [Ichthyobacterium seriolicida]
MKYNFIEIEKKWQKYWSDNQTFKAENDSKDPKCYVLDMFPYPSGAGLHVGHALGYIASDIYSRYKRHKGFNVLHPMGYDSFGLPAEQYAIETGQHPRITTEKNISKYREQLDKIGLSFDWSRQLRTSNPDYYKWTQWIFSQIFNSWYNKDTEKAEKIEDLILEFENNGNENINAVCDDTEIFNAQEWREKNQRQQREILLNYRLAFLSETVVNWCPALGTVLANDEIKDGLSERGGHRVEQKSMKQWSLRITAYADRLLSGLENIDWPESIKETQRNWIGKSIGCEIYFEIYNQKSLQKDTITVFTTRPDTVFGISFIALAPEHPLVKKITVDKYKKEVDDYISQTKKRNERDRISNTKIISGKFTGSYAVHPFTQEKIPIWIGDYVLMNYGTGAVMSVPANDSRDYNFAKNFDLPIKQITLEGDISKGAFESKEGTLINSDFLNGLSIKEATEKLLEIIEEKGIGKRKINYKMRDAVFSRQRYWGEPFPIYFKDDTPYLLEEDELPLKLPEIDNYLPTQEGHSPLGRLKNWETKDGYPLEKNTMPGWAGSSWYFLRYMNLENEEKFLTRETEQYWKDVDLYIGGAEHTTGHLLYSRFWFKFLKDMGIVSQEEPFKKLINQGMIQGTSAFVYRIKGENKFVSKGLKNNYKTTALYVDVNLVENNILNIEGFKKWRVEFANSEFILEEGKYICGSEVEKMSKSKHNVVNPDDIISKYGADTFRMYEMFLGPLSHSKPWSTQGIIGVYNFIKKLWKLYSNDEKFYVSDERASKEELNILHTVIRKVDKDTSKFSFNTSVSAFMVAVNEFRKLKCDKREILEPFIILLSPYAPHISEEIWNKLGHNTSISKEPMPCFNKEFLLGSADIDYPVAFNGKTRFKISVATDMDYEDIVDLIKNHQQYEKNTENKKVKKIVFVPNKIINVVM